MSSQLINDFVIHFLTHNVGDEAVSKWLESENQKEFLNVTEACLKSKKTKLTRASLKKEKKDPNLPKRGKSSYIFFCCENRSLVKENNPDMKNKEIISELGKMWRELDKDSSEAQRYTQLSNEDRERFLKESGEMKLSEGEEDKEEVKLKRKQTGYNLFCKETRLNLKQSNDLSETEIKSEISNRWKNLSVNDKLEFKERAASS